MVDYKDSHYEADSYSTFVYIKNVGTLCIGGINNNQQVYIVSQKQNWPKISDHKAEHSVITEILFHKK